MGAELAAIAGPIGIAAAAIAAIGTVLVSTANDINKVDKAVRGFTKSAEDTKKTSDNIRALQKTFEDIDTKELAAAAKILSKEFGLTGAESIEKIEKALIGTNGQLDLDNIKEYASQIKALGGDADKLLTTLVVSEQEGFFQDKGIDTLKEFGLRIRELPKAAEDALKAVGVDVSKLESDLNSGAKSQSQAFTEIFGDMSKFTTKQRQTLIADLLGGPGEDLGQRGIEMLAKQNKSLDELAKKNADIAKVNERNKKLTEAQGSATRRLVPVIKAVEAIWTNIQTVFFEIMDPITEMLVSFGMMLDDLGIIDAIIINFKVGLAATLAPILALIKGITFIINLFRGLIVIVKDLANKGLELVKKKIVDIFGEERIKRWKEGLTSAITFVKKIWEDFAKGVSDLFEKVANFANGDGFVVNQSSAPGSDKKGEDGSAGGKGTPGALATDPNQALMNNTVGSTTQAEVKQINITIDKLQEIGEQNITGQNVDQFKEQLQQALASIIADTSQL